jgi:VanZ family protein
MPEPLLSPHPGRASRVALAVAVSAAIVIASPGIGEFRAWLRGLLSAHFDLVINTGLAAGVVGALLAGVSRIREHRAARYTLLLVAVALAAVDAVANATGSAESNAVERFHFIEYGLVTWLFFRAVQPREGEVADASTLLLPLLAGLLVGTADEAVQWYVPGRIGELRDILIDGGAVAAGLIFSLGLAPPRAFTRRMGRRSIRRLALMTAVVVAALGGFVRVAHLGTIVRDPAIGAFASRFTAAELADLSADRAVQWRTAPPPASPPLYSREDQYLAEGLWHVQARNDAWARDDLFTAWRENLILERDFAPLLDLGHRWPATQRADARTRTAGLAGQAFVSRAAKVPLYVWPKPLFWSGLGVLVAALLGWGLLPSAL